MTTYLLAYLLTYLLNYLLTYFMEQSPSWEANRSLANQEIPHIFLKLEGSLPRLQQPATCSYREPYQSSPHPHFLKIHLNITLPSMPGSSKWFFPSDFPTKTLYTPLLSPTRATRPAHLILTDVVMPFQNLFSVSGLVEYINERRSAFSCIGYPMACTVSDFS